MNATRARARRNRISWALGILIVPSLIAGCASHYRVTEPSSGKVYYTKRLDKLKSGAVEFTDARTGAEITVQNSEVAKISEKEFKAEVNEK